MRMRERRKMGRRRELNERAGGVPQGDGMGDPPTLTASTSAPSHFDLVLVCENEISHGYGFRVDSETGGQGNE
ncbi:uncharacterized [Tachysurus ichikawai]